jgi:hypothetical protein
MYIIIGKERESIGKMETKPHCSNGTHNMVFSARRLVHRKFVQHFFFSDGNNMMMEFGVSTINRRKPGNKAKKNPNDEMELKNLTGVSG